VGESFREPHNAAKRVIARRLMELGVITKLEQLGKYFMHGTSHYLGLDVHDPGSYGPLKANSVITVEPGIYIPEGSDCDRKWWNIGIRIEDDILITPNGPVNMSGKLVRTADEIEAIVGNAP
jgi:Xaa-Pro aminopeptidase